MSVEGSSSVTDKNKNESYEAMNTFLQGKRHMLVKDYNSASESLEQACEKYTKLYGELGKPCGEVFLYYGLTLLNLSRIENGVLGMDPDDENQGEDSPEEDDNEQEDEEKEGQENEENNKEQEEGKKEGEEENDEELAGEDVGDDSSSSKEANEKVEKDNGENPEEAANETEHEGGNITTLQLAWEVLETAKVIFEKYLETNPELRSSLIETYLALGEVSLESDSHSQAIDDFLHCLCHQKDILAPDDRGLAQTHYQLGLAYSYSNHYSSAVASYKESLKILKLRIENLKGMILRGEEMMDANDPFATPEKEIEDIESLIPDIQAKIEDEESTLANIPESSKKIIENSSGAGSSSSAGPSSSSSSSSCFPNKTIFLADLKEEEKVTPPVTPTKKANDITSLVKRKIELTSVNDISSSVKRKVELIPANDISSSVKRKVELVPANDISSLVKRKVKTEPVNDISSSVKRKA